MSFTPTEPKLDFIFRATVNVALPRELGQTPWGNRRIIDITGGNVEGPAVSGSVLPGGADWQIIQADGTAILEARYTISTDDGALIYVQNRGYRHGPSDVLARIAKGESVDPAFYYFRAAPIFETAAPQYSWLNNTMCLSSGMRDKAQVLLDFYRVQ